MVPGTRSLLCALSLAASCVPASPDARRATPRDPEPDSTPDAGSPPTCADIINARPSAPVLVSPIAGRIDVEPSALTIALAGFSDPDGHAHARTEMELWRVRDGARAERAWRLAAATPLSSASLADGSYENEALQGGGLGEWNDYVARARVADDGGGCDPWSAWSSEVPFRTGDGSTALFDPTQIRTFELTIAPEVIEALNAEAIPPDCIQWPRTPRAASLSVDGVTFDGVGVRIKGGCGSSRTFDQKPSLKIALTWDDPDVLGCPEPRRFHGQRTLTLNNGAQDPSAQHELMGYQLYRAAGVPAPRVAHAWVRVNGEDYGLYQLVETIDRRFLSRHTDNEHGMLYEGAYWCDLLEANLPVDDTSWTCFQREFEPDACDTPVVGADPTSWQLLRDLVRDLDELEAGGFYPAVRELFDFDEFLSMWAVDSMLSHWDAYSFHIINNYRVYHHPGTQLWSMIPWGIDQTFELGGDQHPWDVGARINAMCAADPACDAAFAARLYEVITLFEALDFGAQANVLQERLRPYVDADPRKEYGTGDWEDRHNDTLWWIQNRPARVRELLLERGYVQ